MRYLQIISIESVEILMAAIVCIALTISCHMVQERRTLIRMRKRGRAVNRRKLRNRTIRKMAVSLLRILGTAGVASYLVLCAPVAEAKPKSDVSKRSLVGSGNDIPVVEDVFTEENAELLQLFEEDVFRELSFHERWDALRSVMNLELTYLGCDQVRFTVREMEDQSCLGYYDSSTGRIVLNERTVMNRSGISCLEVLFHEVYHAYQQQCINKLREEHFDSNLKIFREISQWDYETRHYISADRESTQEEWEQYRTQALEMSADEYAEQRVREYKSYYRSSRSKKGQE